MTPRQPKEHWKARENRAAKVAAYVEAIEKFAWHCGKTLAEILPTVERWTAKNWAEMGVLARRSPPRTSKPLIIAALRARAEEQAREALVERLVTERESGEYDLAVLS